MQAEPERSPRIVSADQAATAAPTGAAVPLVVLCAVALQPVLPEIAVDFTAESGQQVALTFDFNPAIARRVESGEPFDVAITNPHLLESLSDLGHVGGGSIRSFGSSPLGIGVRRCKTPADLSTPAALRRLLLSVQSIGYGAEGTSGRLFREMLVQLELPDVIAHKLRPMAGGDAGHAVARGDVEICVVPVTTILAASPATTLAGTFSGDLDCSISFASGQARNVTPHPSAEAFQNYLSREAHDAFLAARGVMRA